MARPNVGYLLAGTAGVLWSTMGVLGKAAFSYGIDPVSLVAFRAIVACVSLALIIAVTNRKLLRVHVRDIPFFLLFGLIGVAANYSSYFYAIKLTTVSTAVVLLYTYPAFVTLFSIHLFKERMSAAKVFALAVTLIGCGLVAQVYDVAHIKLNYIGVLFGLISGLTAAMYSIMSKIALRKYRPSTTTLYAFGFGSLFLLVFSIFTGQAEGISVTDFHLQLWLIILAIAWVPTLAGYFVYTISLKHIEASKASIVSTIEPVASSLLAYIFLREALVGLQILGIGLVLTGIIALKTARS
jgi:drug/metabolite transporter, DME family